MARKDRRGHGGPPLDPFGANDPAWERYEGCQRTPALEALFSPEAGPASGRGPVVHDRGRPGGPDRRWRDCARVLAYRIGLMMAGSARTERTDNSGGPLPLFGLREDWTGDRHLTTVMRRGDEVVTSRPVSARASLS
jgi:hypothetical protein